MFAGFGIPFDLCIVVGDSSCWGLGLQLGNRPLPQHGKWLDRCLLSCVPGVCSQLPHLCLQSLQPGPIAYPEVHYPYTSVHLMTCSRYNSYGTLLMQLLLQKLLFSPVYCVFPIFVFLSVYIFSESNPRAQTICIFMVYKVVFFFSCEMVHKMCFDGSVDVVLPVSFFLFVKNMLGSKKQVSIKFLCRISHRQTYSSLLPSKLMLSPVLSYTSKPWSSDIDIVVLEILSPTISIFSFGKNISN